MSVVAAISDAINTTIEETEMDNTDNFASFAGTFLINGAEIISADK